jgi:hypothetical protein
MPNYPVSFAEFVFAELIAFFQITGFKKNIVGRINSSNNHPKNRRQIVIRSQEAARQNETEEISCKCLSCTLQFIRRRKRKSLCEGTSSDKKKTLVREMKGIVWENCRDFNGRYRTGSDFKICYR